MRIRMILQIALLSGLASIASSSMARDPPLRKPGGETCRINSYIAADPRDPLESALIRLARGAMAADLSSPEAWLYDRASVYYKLGCWSGLEEFRRHALLLVERYYSNVDSDGYFKLKSERDSKYSYLDGAVWYEWETGNPRFRAKAEAIYRMWLKEFPDEFSPRMRMWTERKFAYAFGAAIGWYELSGDQSALSRARALLRQWTTMSNGSGAPLHTLAQHQEEFDPPWNSRRMTSPWMSAPFFEYLRRYYAITGEVTALSAVSRYADYLIAHCLYDGKLDHPNLAGRLMPYYLCDQQGSYEKESPSESDGEHTPDVMGIFAFAVRAKRLLGVDADPALRAYRGLRESSELFVGRRQDVDPPRKINWWIGTSYDATFLVQPAQRLRAQ